MLAESSRGRECRGRGAKLSGHAPAAPVLHREAEEEGLRKR